MGEFEGPDGDGDFTLVPGTGRIGTLTNTGTIQGGDGRFGNGVRAPGGIDQLNNAEAAVISGREFGVLTGGFDDRTQLTLNGDAVNNGLIEARDVNEFGGGTGFAGPNTTFSSIINGPSGVIQGVTGGVDVAGVALFDNAGVIRGDSDPNDDISGSGVSVDDEFFRDPNTGNQTLVDGSGVVEMFINREGGIISGDIGVDIDIGVETLTNAGVIDGTLANAINVTRAFEDADGDGQFTPIEGTGRIGTFTNSGQILVRGDDPGPFNNGVAVRAQEIETFVNSGQILATRALDSRGQGQAIFANEFGAIENSGLIQSGPDEGDVRVTEAGDTRFTVQGRTIQTFELQSLDNTGVIRSTVDDALGLFLDGGFDEDGNRLPQEVIPSIANNSDGVIEGFDDGIQFTGEIGSINNSGLIAGGQIFETNSSAFGTANDGVSGIFFPTPDGNFDAPDTIGILRNEADASIIGNSSAIQVTQLGTVTNAGRMTGGIFGISTSPEGPLFGFRDLSNLAPEQFGLDDLSNTGTIQGGRAGVYVTGSVGTLTNSGIIEATDAPEFDPDAASFAENAGVWVAAPTIFGDTDGDGFDESVVGFVAGEGQITSLVNTETGVVRGGQGVFAADISTFENAGLIEATSTILATDAGVPGLGGSGVNVVIQGEGTGSTIGSFNNAETGQILATFRGVRAFRIDDFANAGLIEVTTQGVFSDADSPEGVLPGVGVTRSVGATEIGSFRNAETGILRGGDSGVVVTLSDDFENAGTIEGVMTGIAATELRKAVNFGTIRSTGETGVGVLMADQATLDLFNASRDDALTGNDVFTNRGLIETAATNGVAIDFGAGDDTLTIESGYSFGDDRVLGGDGFDALVLGAGGGFVDLANFEAFERLSLLGGTDWAISGASAVDVLVSQGSRFSGAWQIGGLTVESGGVLAPGASIGTLIVNGDVIFREGSTLEAEIDAVEGGDLIAATGAATIEGGTLRVIPLSLEADFVNGDSIPLITAEQGVTGAFDAVESDSSLIFETRNEGDALFLDVQAFNPDTVGGNSNVQSVAGALFDAAADAGGDLADIANTVAALPEDQQQLALQSLSGQPHAETTQAVAQASQDNLNALGGGSGDDFGDPTGAGGGVRRIEAGLGAVPVGVFAGPVFSFGGADEENGIPGYDVSNQGFAFGLDYKPKIEAMRGVEFGASVGYSRFLAESTEGLGDTRSNNLSFGLNGRLRRAGWRAQASVGYTTMIGLESERAIILGAERRTATAEYDAFALAASARASYRFKALEALKRARFEPFGFVDYGRFDRDAFQETGANGADLDVDAATLNSVLTGGGIVTSWRFERGQWSYSPALILGASYEVGDEQGFSSQQFDDASDGVGEFDVVAAERSRLFGRLGAQFLVSPGFTDVGFGFAYEAEVDSTNIQHVIRLRATKDF